MSVVVTYLTDRPEESRILPVGRTGPEPRRAHRSFPPKGEKHGAVNGNLRQRIVILREGRTSQGAHQRRQMRVCCKDGEPSSSNNFKPANGLRSSAGALNLRIDARPGGLAWTAALCSSCSRRAGLAPPGGEPPMIGGGPPQSGEGGRALTRPNSSDLHPCVPMLQFSIVAKSPSRSVRKQGAHGVEPACQPVK
jgi:hypothetical protein